MANLPIARSGNEVGFVLSAESLHKILQLAGNQVETLDYLQAALAGKVGKAAEFAGLIQEVAKLVENAVFQEQEKEKLNPWSGAPKLTDLLGAYFSKTEFSAFQEFMAAKSVNAIEEASITLDYAVSQSAQFKRAYTRDGQMLVGAELDAMDTLFNAWLAKNNLISQGGSIYAGTSKGEIKQHNGQPVIADPHALIARLNEGEFERYVHEKNKKITIAVRENDYGDTQPEPA